LLTAHAIHWELVHRIGKEPTEYLIIRTTQTRPVPSKSTLEALPAELRQHVLSYAIDDEAILITPHLFARAVTDLGLTSRILHADVQQVKKRWKRRAEKILKKLQRERRPTAELIGDLWGPIGDYKRHGRPRKSQKRNKDQASFLRWKIRMKRQKMEAAGVKEGDRNHICFD